MDTQENVETQVQISNGLLILLVGIIVGFGVGVVAMILLYLVLWGS